MWSPVDGIHHALYNERQRPYVRYLYSPKQTFLYRTAPTKTWREARRLGERLRVESAVFSITPENTGQHRMISEVNEIISQSTNI